MRGGGRLPRLVARRDCASWQDGPIRGGVGIWFDQKDGVKVPRCLHGCWPVLAGRGEHPGVTQRVNGECSAVDDRR